MRPTYLDELNERRAEETVRWRRTVVDAIGAVRDAIPEVASLMGELADRIKEASHDRP